MPTPSCSRMRSAPAKSWAGISTDVRQPGRSVAETENSKSRPPPFADLKLMYRMLVLSFTSSPDLSRISLLKASSLSPKKAVHNCTTNGFVLFDRANRYQIHSWAPHKNLARVRPVREERGGREELEVSADC